MVLNLGTIGKDTYEYWLTFRCKSIDFLAGNGKMSLMDLLPCVSIHQS
jgi:hypothetical protein